MNKMTKKTAFGITGAAAATLMVAGFAAPAMADDTTSSWDYSSSTSTTSATLADLFRTGDVSNDSPIVLAPSIGDVGNGNHLLSGNEVNAPVASGNETVLNNVASGNSASDIASGNANGNGAWVSGGDIGTSVDDLVDGGDIGTSVDNLVDGDIGANVDSLVGDILASVGLQD